MAQSEESYTFGDSHVAYFGNGRLLRYGMMNNPYHRSKAVWSSPARWGRIKPMKNDDQEKSQEATSDREKTI